MDVALFELDSGWSALPAIGTFPSVCSLRASFNLSHRHHGARASFSSFGQKPVGRQSVRPASRV